MIFTDLAKKKKKLCALLFLFSHHQLLISKSEIPSTFADQSKLS